MTYETISAVVDHISPLTDSIMQLVLNPSHYQEYQAGQYLQLILGEEALSYSIANAPLGSKKYELHIRHSINNQSNQKLFSHIKQEGKVNIQIPFGNCSIERLDPARPIIFIAGGTGFAPVKAMIEQLLSNANQREIEFYWGARMRNDLYMHEKVLHWQRCVNHLKYFSVVSEETPQSLDSLVLSHHPYDLNDWQIVISGPFDMVYRLRDILVKQGASKENMYSDAFDFETFEG